MFTLLWKDGLEVMQSSSIPAKFRIWQGPSIFSVAMGTENSVRFQRKGLGKESTVTYNERWTGRQSENDPECYDTLYT